MSATQEQWVEQVSGVLETLNQGAIINDQHRRVVFANSMFLEMIGLRAEQLLGRSVADLFPPEDIPRLLEFIGRRETQGRAQYEFYIPQSSGGHLPVAVTARQVRPFDDQVFSIITATDISELKRTEQELREANALLLARHRQMEEELHLAERVQQSLAPKGLAWGRASVEAYYLPAHSIGGDYGLIRPSANHLDLLVCDVSGHGISSALIANRIYSETMAQVESGAELGSMLRHLNQFVVQNLASAGSYFTMAAARFNPASSSVLFAGAGHPPAMIVAPGQRPRLLESNSMVLGLFDEAVDAAPVIETPVRSGDRLVMYTDGLTESFNPDGVMLGIEGLAQIARDSCSLPLRQMKDVMLERVAKWSGAPAVDDVSLVLLEIA